MGSGGTARWAGALWASAAAGAILGAAGCSSEDPPPAACPRSEATFRLEITAEDGALPEDTSITVEYQGSRKESFALPTPPIRNEDVCCRASSAPLSTMPQVDCPGAGTPDSGQAQALYCELWTSGIATIIVSGGEYPEIVETLEAVEREDECGLATKSVRIVLAHPDGG